MFRLVLALVCALVCSAGFAEAAGCVNITLPLPSALQGCTANYSISSTYTNATATNYKVTQTMIGVYKNSTTMSMPIPKSCGNAYQRFYCNDIYPSCPSDSSKGYQQVRACKSACEALQVACAPWLSYFTSGKSYINADAYLPVPADCSIYSEDASCSNVDGANTDFFYPDESPTEAPTTQVPTKKPSGGGSSDNNNNKYPGGATKGGILAAGLLVVIMAFIGLMGVFMKKQERR